MNTVQALSSTSFKYYVVFSELFFNFRRVAHFCTDSIEIMQKLVTRFAVPFQKLLQTELNFILKKLSARSNEFAKRRGFTTQQQPPNATQSSSKNLSTSTQHQASSQSPPQIPSKPQTQTQNQNPSAHQPQSSPQSQTQGSPQPSSQTQSQPSQSTGVRSAPPTAPSGITARQVRQTLLKGNRFTRLVSFAVLASFAATTGYYLYDWHNTSATRYKQLRTMLRVESSSNTKVRAFESLLAGVNVHKRTFSGRVAIPLDTPADDFENGPASLFPLVLEAIKSDDSRVRGLALSWLSHVAAIPQLHQALLQHPDIVHLLTREFYNVPHDPTDTSPEHNRDWILSAATLLHLLHSPRAEVTHQLIDSAEVQSAAQKLSQSHHPLAALFGSELTRALRGGDDSSWTVTRSMSTRLVTVAIAEAQRSASSTAHLNVPQREVATELLVRSVRYLRAWYHHLFGSYDVEIAASESSDLTARRLSNAYTLSPIQSAAPRGIEGATAVSVLGLGLFAWLWGRLGWWLRGGVKAAASKALTIRNVAPIVRSRHVGRYFTLLLAFDLTSSHVLRAASTRDLSFDFTRLATLNELFPSFVRFLNRHLGPNSALFSSLNARFAAAHPNEYPIPMVSIFPIVQATLFTLGTLLLIRTQRFVVLPLLVALSWNQRDWLFGPSQGDGSQSATFDDLSLQLLRKRVVRLCTVIQQWSSGIFSHHRISSSSTSTSLSPSPPPSPPPPPPPLSLPPPSSLSSSPATNTDVSSEAKNSQQ